MPGIVGIISLEPFRPDVVASIDRMAAPLQYKADQTIRHFQRDWFAGAVVDYGRRFPFLKSAFAERDGVLLFMEGEVFPDSAEVPHEMADNNPSVQRAEYCLYQYLNNGQKFILNLNGVFSIAIIDFRDNSIHLYTDKFGHRLMFIAEKSNQFAFATSVRSLLRWQKDIGLKYDEQSLADFVVFERVLGDRTLFPDIKRLLPASHAAWINSKWHTELYYEMHKQELPDKCNSWEDGAHMLLDCLKRSLDRRTADHSTAGLLLSGGLDSRLVMLACPRPVITASISNSEGNLSLEDQIAAKVAQVHGVKQILLPRSIDYYAQIADDAAQVNEGLSSAFVGCHSLGLHDIMNQNGFQVVLTGDRFDAAFKVFWDGLSLDSRLYRTGPTELDIRRIARILADSPLIRWAEHQDLMMLALNKKMKDTAVLMKEKAIAMLEQYCLCEIRDNGNNIYDILRLLSLGGPFWQGFTSMGMLRGLASQFPERSPFFDNEMLNLALSFPVSWALRGRIVRRAIKIASPKIAKIRDVNTRLPAGLCPPWDRLALEPRELLLKIGRHLSIHSNFVAKLRQPRAGTNVFSSRGWLFSHNAALIHSQLYRALVEDAVKNASGEFFDVDVLKRLLNDDINSGVPRLSKLWHMLVSFRSFDKMWGPSAPR